MEISNFLNILKTEFYTGVPDSQLKALCNYLISKYGTVNGRHHIIAANEGNATAIAVGYYLSTGKIPVVYMQNSGEGNVINPVASLCNDQVYGIPIIFIVGWRGEPGIHDEPQHVYQGAITKKLLEIMDIKCFEITKEVTEADVRDCMKSFYEVLLKGKQVAFIVKKGSLIFSEKIEFKNEYSMMREEIIEHVIKFSESDTIISTTGKTSRELFEIRKRNGQSHETDFLTVGSMGHCSSIALGVALNQPKKKVWCIDGDGAVLMHMGAMPVIAELKPENLIHVVINNEAHESVGGQPNAMKGISIARIAEACGYPYAVRVKNIDELDRELQKAKKSDKLCMIEVETSIGARKDLGRPTISTKDNKIQFMNFLHNTI